MDLHEGEGEEFTKDEDEDKNLQTERKSEEAEGLYGVLSMDAQGLRQRGASVEQHGDEPVPQCSVESWILFVTGVHEEATEEDIHDKFAEYGKIKNTHLNLARRTGYLKVCTLVE